MWLVEKFYDYEGTEVVGVFSTEEKALRYVASLAKDGISCGAKLSIWRATVDAHECPCVCHVCIKRGADHSECEHSCALLNRDGLLGKVPKP